MRGEIAGRYVLRGERDASPAGHAHDAVDRLTGRRVAITHWPLPLQSEDGAAALVARMRQGARAAARLNHPNIVAVLDQGEEAGQGWLVTEAVVGETLSHLLRHGRIPPAQSVAIALQVLDALAYAHAMGIAHRGLDPDTVIVGPDQRASITGFGVAMDLSLRGQASLPDATLRDAVPERRRGERLDHRADIWAVGAMLRRMLAGDDRAQQASGAGLRLPPALRAFEAVLAKALAEYPEDRFASASEFASALRAAAESEWPGSPHAPVPVPLPIREEEGGTQPPADAFASLDVPERPVRPPLSTPVRPARVAATRARRRWRRRLAMAAVAMLAAGGIALVVSNLDRPGSVFHQATPLPAMPAPDAGAGAEAPHGEAAGEAVPAPRIEAAAAAIPATLSCGLVAVAVADGVLDVMGVLKSSEQPTLSRVLDEHRVPAAATRLSVATFDGPYCPVLDAARPFVAAPGAGPRVSLLSPVPLPVGRRLRFSIEAPSGWPAVHLSVTYLTIEGYVGHLVGAEMAAGTTVTFADPSWLAGQPLGTDLMLVIAADRPLFPPRAERARVERIPDFAAALAVTLREARDAGASVALRAVAVPIVAP